MTPTIVLWLLLGAAVAVLLWRSSRLIGPVMISQPAMRFDQPGRRLQGLLAAIGHRRLIRNRYSGILHAMIFVSFFVLATAIVQSFGSVLFPGFSLAPVGGDTWIALAQDVFAIVMLTGVALAAWQRLVLRPARFKGSNNTDANIIYILIVIIVVTMLLEAAFAIVAGSGASAIWRPVSATLGAAFTAMRMSPEFASQAHDVFYWLHVGAILAFVVYIPGSKHRHMLLAAPNVYFRSLKPIGRFRGRRPKSRHRHWQQQPTSRGKTCLIPTPARSAGAARRHVRHTLPACP